MDEDPSQSGAEPSRPRQPAVWRLAVALGLTVALAVGAQEPPAEDLDGLHHVVELQIGLAGATPATVVHRGAREGPTADAAEVWTEVEGAVVPIGLAIGILDPDDKVLGVRLFQPGKEGAAVDGDAVEGDTVVGAVLIEPGVDGEVDVGEVTYVVHLVDVRREPIRDGSTDAP